MPIFIENEFEIVVDYPYWTSSAALSINRNGFIIYSQVYYNERRSKSCEDQDKYYYDIAKTAIERFKKIETLNDATTFVTSQLDDNGLAENVMVNVMQYYIDEILKK